MVFVKSVLVIGIPFLLPLLAFFFFFRFVGFGVFFPLLLAFAQ